MNKNKIVFLDIDGVLNNNTSHHVLVDEAIARGDSPNWVIDPENMRLFNQLLQQAPEAQVVLSSSWRFFFAQRMDEFRSLMMEKGMIDHHRIIDTTAKWLPGAKFSSEPPRVMKIADWVRRNGANQFVILDDNDIGGGSGNSIRSLENFEESFFDGVDDPPPRTDFKFFLDRFVKTDETVGLTEADVEKAVKILMREA